MKKKIKKYIGEIFVVIGSFLAVYGFLGIEYYRSSSLSGVGLLGDSSIYKVNFYYYAQNTKFLTAFGVALAIFGALIIINKFRNK